MLFNSLDFIIFILIFFIGWPVLNKSCHSRWLYLTVASFVFYGWWNWYFLFLIVLSGMVDYSVAIMIDRNREAGKFWLVMSLAANLGILFIFKYYDFAVQNLNSIFNITGIKYTIGKANLLLPVGISFYTFQSMSYTIDVYRGKLKPTRNPFHFFAYLSMFPQLVAGPIVRASDILDQLASKSNISEHDKFVGLRLIAFGYFKKVVCADNIARAVNEAFAGEMVHNGLYWWLIAFMFACQIYCDFSGYSDIACGLARWMGYKFKPNFNHPYISASFSEFWTRWHISLSSWFRDYVYIALGGSRFGKAKMYRNLWITMMLSGLWHGAAWTYLAWGGVHSLYLSLEKLTGWPKKIQVLPLGKYINIVIVFVLVLLSWIFFRAETLSDALRIIKCMMTSFTVSPVSFYIKAIGYKAIAASLFIGLAHVILGLVFVPDNTALISIQEKISYNRSFVLVATAGQSVFVGFILFCCIFFRGNAQEFIYFQF